MPPADEALVQKIDAMASRPALHNHDLHRMRIESFKVRKGDEGAFLAALEELPGKMLLCGHVDYMDFCRALGQAMGAEETEKEEAAQDAKAGPIEQTE